MPLVASKRASHAFEIYDGSPETSAEENVIFMPMTLDNHRQDHNWGIYKKSGVPVEEAIWREAGVMIGQTSLNVEIPPCPQKVSGSFFYAGILSSHYGHFVTESLARLWALSKIPVKPRILIHIAPSGVMEDTLRLEFVSRILEIVGLKEGDFITFFEPTEIEELIIPAPSIELNSYAYSVYKSFARSIGRAINTQKSAKCGPVWFSRTALQWGVKRIVNEFELVERLQEKGGFEIIHPELLTFDQKISLFSTPTVISGFVQSAFHSSIFSAPLSKMRCILNTNQIDSTFLMMDHLNGNDAIYYDTEGNLSYENFANGEHRFIINDCASLARAIIEMVNQ